MILNCNSLVGNLKKKTIQYFRDLEPKKLKTCLPISVRILLSHSLKKEMWILILKHTHCLKSHKKKVLILFKLFCKINTNYLCKYFIGVFFRVLSNVLHAFQTSSTNPFLPKSL